MKNTFKAAFKKSMPVFAGYLALGMGFGVLLEAKGYGLIWAFVMSLTIFAGTLQYVAIDLLAGGASLLHSAFMTVMISARQVFYGISMLKLYKGMGKIKPYLGFALTDETYSLVCRGDIPEGVENRKQYYLFLSMLNQSYWILGGLIGNLIGSLIEFNSAGVEFSMTAIFVVIFIEQWQSGGDHTSSLIGVISTAVCLLIFGAETFLIPALLLIAVSLCVLRRKRGI